MAKIIPARKINHCGECSWMDTEKCPHQTDGVDLFNFIPDDCPLLDCTEPDRSQIEKEVARKIKKDLEELLRIKNYSISTQEQWQSYWKEWI